MKAIVTINYTDYLLPSQADANKLVEIMSRACLVNDRRFESVKQLTITLDKGEIPLRMEMVTSEIKIREKARASTRKAP